MDYGIVYCAYNLKNEKRYIGQTIHSLEKRIRGHYSKYSNCVFFKKALQKYEKTDWEWYIIDSGSSQEDLDYKETFWIAFFNTTDSNYGYNLTLGGQGSKNIKVSDEKKKKTRESMLKAVCNNYSKKDSLLKPVRCIELKKDFSSYSEASRATGANSNSIRRVINGSLKTAGGYHWELLKGEERVRALPNAIYCVELNIIYDNIRQARTISRFHEGNLKKAMDIGTPFEEKKYAGYTFYWINPQYH